ncbi:hypothetical protein POPTR_008G087651v4 [Populus trichocarpa]|uniref:Uncharacterized protein n=1 Tax=Populus trichocarpa TaxID=3694 RepID=A0ACC0SKM8_POPTR|nr:hypothetical protein BDE02_08G077700 [Populus trichocarpa]KAI9389746.1 hypothetical protein POPTR_008G087651v4 [Populus trichocarpa]
MMFGVHEENLAFGSSRIVIEWIQELYCPGSQNLLKFRKK